MARLTIEIDSRTAVRQARQVRSAIRGIGDEAQRTERRTTQLGRRASDRLSGVSRSAGNAARSFTRMGRAVGGVIGILGGAATLALVRFSDAATQVQNSLRIAGLSGQELTDTYQQLFDIAQRNAAPFEALTRVYGQASLAARELGASNDELIGLTESVGLALRISGQSAQEAQGALLQLSQALGSGTVRAEEFNSIVEGLRPLAQAAADGIEEAGGSIARLRQLMLDGQISSQEFFQAIQAGTPGLRDLAERTTPTLRQQMSGLRNSLVAAAGEFNSTARLTQGLSSAMGGLQQIIDNMDFSKLGEAIRMMGEGFGWVANQVGGLIGKLQELDKARSRREAAANIGRLASPPQSEREANLINRFEGAFTQPEDSALAQRLESDPLYSFSGAQFGGRVNVPTPTFRIRPIQAAGDAADNLGTSLGRVASSYSDATRESERFSNNMDRGQRAAEQFASSAESFTLTLVDGLFNGASAAETLSNALRQLASTLLSNAFSPRGGGGLLSALFGGFGGGFGAITGGGAQVAAATAGAVGLFAQGGAFTNGIVTRPTLFPMANGAGLMGEAGPEAVMPLARGRDGSLGVRASGGGAAQAVMININLAGANGNQEVAAIARDAVVAGLKEYDRSNTNRVAIGVRDAQSRGMLNLGR